MPFRRVTPFARLGYWSWERDGVASAGPERPVSGGGEDLLWGVGVEVRLARAWSLRAEWESFSDIMDEDIDRISGNLLFRF